jgi:hypothetical protein
MHRTTHPHTILRAGEFARSRARGGASSSGKGSKHESVATKGFMKDER